MVRAAHKAEICWWLHSKLSANSLVRWNVMFNVRLIERRVPHVLDASHLVKNSSFHETDVTLKKKKLSTSLSTAFHSMKCVGKYHGQWLNTIVQKSTVAANISYLALPVTPRRRSNSIPWCTSLNVILPLRTWHSMINNLQHARNKHRSARCGWFGNIVSVQRLPLLRLSS